MLRNSRKKTRNTPYGSIMERLLSALLDHVFLFVFGCCGGFAGGLISASITLSDQSATTGILLGFTFWSIFAAIVNHGIIQGIAGATVGKSLMGLRVVHTDGTPIEIGTSVMRSACYAISVLPAGLGLLAMVLSEKRQ